jgi:hypothetical protein
VHTVHTCALAALTPPFKSQKGQLLQKLVP